MPIGTSVDSFVIVKMMIHADTCPCNSPPATLLDHAPTLIFRPLSGVRGINFRMSRKMVAKLPANIPHPIVVGKRPSPAPNTVNATASKIAMGDGFDILVWGMTSQEIGVCGTTAPTYHVILDTGAVVTGRGDQLSGA